MPQTNAAATSNVTIIPPRPDNLHEAIELMHNSQITGDYRYPAMALAGPLMSEVGRVFPLHMILIYLTTSYKRRQIWNAYIAAMFADPDNPRPILNPDAVRSKLMNSSSKELLQKAYGPIPNGFETALERLGLDGQAPHIYLLLHKLMMASEAHRKAFSHAAKIEAKVVETLVALPEPLQSYELAKQFRGPDHIKTMTFIIDTLAQGDAVKYAMLCAKVVDAAKRGQSVAGVLKSAYHDIPFASPAIQDSEHCRYISSAAELKKAAIQFSNCLKDYVPEAHNTTQYYRWYEEGRPIGIASIRIDAPFGYRLTEIQGKRNEPLDHELELKIIKYFEKHGVHNMASMEGLLRELGGMLNRGRRRDPVDEINDVIDELLDDGPT